MFDWIDMLSWNGWEKATASPCHAAKKFLAQRLSACSLPPPRMLAKFTKTGHASLTDEKPTVLHIPALDL
jgi:hypothetical protein